MVPTQVLFQSTLAYSVRYDAILILLHFTEKNGSNNTECTQNIAYTNQEEVVLKLQQLLVILPPHSSAAENSG